MLAALDPAVPRIAEPARELLADLGGRPPGHDEFVAGLLARSIDKWHVATPAGPTVYDRGVPDCVAYALYLGTDLEPSRRAARRYRYEPEVLLLEPWEDIYTTDAERTMTYAMTERFHECVVEAFTEAGYTLVPVPQASVAARAEFVAQRVGA